MNARVSAFNSHSHRRKPIGFLVLVALGCPVRKKMQRGGPTGTIRSIHEITLDENRVVSEKTVK
jgi:hypothetical protein